MRIIFVGSGEFALPTLMWLVESEHEVPLVVTQPSRPSGRGRHTTPTPVHALATLRGIETIEPEDINEPEIVARLRGCDARLGVVVAFGQKLGPGVLGAMPGGCVNLHASLLPRLRGAAPINWAIARGERRTGCSVFRVVSRMDAGPILATCETDIAPDETAGELHDRLARFGVDALQEAVALYDGDAIPSGAPQDDSQATTAPKLKKADGFVRFDRSAKEVINRIRGMTPWPGAAARYESDDGRWEKVIITRARVVEGVDAYDLPGTLDDQLRISARDGLIEIVELKPSSGRIMGWSDYCNGRNVNPGDIFTTPKKK